MKMSKIPSISIIINYYNEEENLKRLLPSLKKQNYPNNKLEYIFIDDNSTDNSSSIVKSFGGKIIKVSTHDIELNKGVGMHEAKNDIICWLDADMELCNNDFFTELVRPMIENREIVGSFTKEFDLDCGKLPDSSILRFISYDILQRDPLFQFFSIPLDKSIIEKRGNYYICRFIPGKMPPVGRITYRRKELLGTKMGQMKPFIDMEAVEIVARAGYQLFAYTPMAKMKHYHAETLSLLVKKRLRNLERDYLPNIGNKYFTWINLSNRWEVLKIIFWIMYANLFIPELIRGVLRSLYHKDISLLLQPVISISVTDAIVLGFIKKKSGRKFILNLVSNIFK